MHKKDRAAVGERRCHWKRLHLGREKEFTPTAWRDEKTVRGGEISLVCQTSVVDHKQPSLSAEVYHSTGALSSPSYVYILIYYLCRLTHCTHSNLDPESKPALRSLCVSHCHWSENKQVMYFFFFFSDRCILYPEFSPGTIWALRALSAQPTFEPSIIPHCAHSFVILTCWRTASEFSMHLSPWGLHQGFVHSQVPLHV